MVWLQLKIQTTKEYVEAITAMLNLFGAKSVSILDAADQPILEPLPGTTPIWENDWVVGLFDPNLDGNKIIAFLLNQFSENVIQQYVIEHLADQNWERAWLDNFHPMQFGKRLWICPSVQTPPDPHAINIILDPGLAFGTGTHPTTALCLKWLDANPPTDEIVIDYGCGSGILAIAALKLGAREVWAVDYDEQALEATKENAERNQINLNTIHIIKPEQLPSIKADTILANILAQPLIELAPKFSKLLKPAGKLALSGILKEQINIVQNAYINLVNLKAPTLHDEWVLLTGHNILDS